MVKNPFKRRTFSNGDDKSPNARSASAEEPSRSGTFIGKTRKLFTSLAKQPSVSVASEQEIVDDEDGVSFVALESEADSFFKQDTFLDERFGVGECESNSQQWEAFDRLMSLDPDAISLNEGSPAHSDLAIPECPPDSAMRSSEVCVAEDPTLARWCEDPTLAHCAEDPKPTEGDSLSTMFSIATPEDTDPEKNSAKLIPGPPALDASSNQDISAAQIKSQSPNIQPEEIFHFGFVVPANNKYRNIKGILYRWARICKSEETEWMLYLGEKEDNVGVVALSSLAGCTIVDGGCECMTRDGSRVMHVFRIYPPPGLSKYDSLQFGVDSATQAQQWITALRSVSLFNSAKPTATLQISVQKVELWAEDNKRKLQCQFVVLRFNEFVSRTDTCDEQARFHHSCSFPIVVDDPDTLVEIQINDAMGRNKLSSESKLIGVVSVPLEAFQRGDNSMTLLIRDVELMERGCLRKGCSLGEIHFKYTFNQPLLSLFMPLPRLRLMQYQEMRRIKELEGLTLRNRIPPEQRQFNMFTMRLLENARVVKVVSKSFQRIVMWMDIYQTAGCLIALTAYILWIYVYTLHLVIFGLLLLTVHRHPYIRSSSLYSSLRQVSTRLRDLRQLSGTLESEEMFHSAESGSNISKEIILYQNERRLPFGRWGTKWLTFGDPPSWLNTKTNKKSAAPEAMERVYRWDIGINEHTDEDGWQYSTAFKSDLWSNTFSIKASSVRRRKHIGTPEIHQGSKKVRSELSRAAPRVSSSAAQGAAYIQMFEKILARLHFQERLWTYWLDYAERRKNLFSGQKMLISNVMLVLLSAALLLVCVVPTQWLILAYVYLYFYSGYTKGIYYREIRSQMIEELKTAMQAVGTQVTTWDTKTPMRKVLDAIGLIALRDWLTAEYFQDPLPLRSVSECATLEELAHMVVQSSLKYNRTQERRRVWWKMSFSAFLDHVGSDVRKFDACSATFYKAPDPNLASVE